VVYVLQTGVKVTNVNDLQDIDELCVVEVRLQPKDRSVYIKSMTLIACATSSSVGPQFVVRASTAEAGITAGWRKAKHTQLSPAFKLQQLT
jgi:hypothetical protein